MNRNIPSDKKLNNFGNEAALTDLVRASRILLCIGYIHQLLNRSIVLQHLLQRLACVGSTDRTTVEAHLSSLYPPVAGQVCSIRTVFFCNCKSAPVGTQYSLLGNYITVFRSENFTIANNRHWKNQRACSYCLDFWTKLSTVLYSYGFQVILGNYYI